MPLCGSKHLERRKTRTNLLIQNQELLRLRLTNEEKVFYSELYYENAVGGKVLKSNFLPLLGMLGTQIAEEFAERIFLAFSSNKKDITLCEYLKYIDIYHYGDDKERCRVTCKLIDKKSTGIIKLEDFRSYIDLIMNAVKKVNGGSDQTLMSDQDVRDLFYHISKDKESFTYQEFEDIYKEKPELVSWFDYFKNNKEDMLLIIDQNVRNLLNLITEFLASFMDDLIKVLEKEEEIELSVFMQKVYYYSNELEKFRKKFLKKINKFNIRTAFDKLQNNKQTQKTTELINALQKKVLNEGGNNDQSSSFLFSRLESIDKRNESSKIGDGANFLQSFKTVNMGVSNKNKSIQSTGNISSTHIQKNKCELMSVHTIRENVNNNNDHTGMAKFFQKIKNNLERTLSTKNDVNPNLSKRTLKKPKDESSSSDDDQTESKENWNNEGSKNSKKTKRYRGSIFELNFKKQQQTLFGNKVFKFGGNKNNNLGIYESSMNDNYGHRSKKKFMSNFDINMEDDIEEVEEEDMNETTEPGMTRISVDYSKKMRSYKRVKSQMLTDIKKNDYRKKDSKLSEIKPKKFKTTKKSINSDNELISDDASLYDKSDYEQTLRCGTIVEPDKATESNISDRKISNSVKNKYISKSSQKIIKDEEEKNNSINFSKKILNHNSKNRMSIKISYANDPNYIHKSKLKKYILKIKSLYKQSNGLNQLLFCARVAIESALEVCTTVSSCYKWIGDNYLESQIKKVIKEAKLKEKQKEDKEKYGNIGNGKKPTPAKKNIIRASDQSFKLLLNMIMGIQIAVQSIPNFHVKAQEDLNKYLTNMLYSIQTINFGKRKEEVFILKEFAGIIFNNIRLYLGFDKEDFIASISPQDFITELMISNQTIFEELCSTGRSGSLFYYTRDGKFIVKTIKRDEYKFIKQILPDYFRHLKANPLSLLPKFLGCYVLTRKIKKKREKIYFIVMINVFATSKHIHIRYDLKGSRIGRRVLTGKGDAEILAKGDLALKDLDLEKRKEKIYIGEKTDILLKQIKNDADFLCKIGTNDYSLLLGIHYIDKERRPGQHDSFTNFVQSRSKTNVEDSIIKEASLSDKSCDSRQEKLKVLADFEDGGIISETGNEVYFVGIIDILTKFNWKKKCEHFAKMVRYCSNNMSCTPPQMYRDRFVNYMSKVIQKTSPFSAIKNPMAENLSNLNVSNNNSSNNILIQNNTNNYFNIINNNNSITVSPVDEINHLNQNQMNGIKKERYSLSYKFDPKEVIKEESEVEKASVESSKKSSSKNNSSSHCSGSSDESKSNN